MNDFTAQSAITIIAPKQQTTPVVFLSPHSGRVYPSDFLMQSRLDPLALRSSEDAYVDELFSGVSALGAPLLQANFPRVYLDANREPLELDPTMFNDALPKEALTNSPRVQAGIGTIARVVNNNQKIYKYLLPYSEAEKRLKTCYVPYHKAVKKLIDQTMDTFGTCLLIDCHSMPSPKTIAKSSAFSKQAEIVLGDRWGASCESATVAIAERTMLSLGYSVRTNTPYAGGFTTQHYGQPSSGVQALQVEIDRSLYMDERSLSKLPVFDSVRERLTRFAEALCTTRIESLAAQ